MTPVLTGPFPRRNLASAFVIASTFLASNGLEFTGQDLPMVETARKLAQRQQSEAKFAQYLRCNRDPVWAASDARRRR